jgi:hypothetical protein
MSKSFLACAAAVALPLWIAAGALPAQAGALSFVSSKGANHGDCSSPAAACATFQYAVSQTWPGGEVKALDAGSYGAVVIDKSITISGVEGAAIFQPTGEAIKIAVGANDKVVLSNLAISGPTRIVLTRVGAGTSAKGVVYTGGGSLTIDHCTIRNFFSGGVDITSTSPLKLLIDGVTVANTGGVGLYARPASSSAPLQGLLQRLSATGNSGHGVVLDGAGLLDIIESVISHNGGAGVAVPSAGVLRLAHSFVTGNSGKGVFLTVGGQSDGRNVIMGNGAGPSDNLVGHLTVAPTF